MAVKLIDVSEWQGNIDYAKVKASGIKGVIIRAGYGKFDYQKDKFFESNYTKAKAAGLDCGVYWYSYADSTASAIEEARVCMKALKGKKFEYPIYFDLEEQSQFSRGRAFCDSIDYTTTETQIPIATGNNTLTVDTAVQPKSVFVKFEG